jgi:hypothetical protein
MQTCIGMTRHLRLASSLHRRTMTRRHTLSTFAPCGQLSEKQQVHEKQPPVSKLTNVEK